MKVVLANNYYYVRGGSERVFFDEMKLLRDKGHKVAAFSRHHAENLDSEYSGYFAPTLELKNSSLWRKTRAALKMVYSNECKKQMSALLSSYQPGIIHAHNIYGKLTTSVLDAAKNHGVPVVMTLHDYKLVCPTYLMIDNGSVCEKCLGGNLANCFLNRCHRDGLAPSLVFTVESYFNRILKKYDSVKYYLCPSAFSLKKHAQGGIPEGKLVQLPNFIDIRKYEPEYQPGNYALYVGRLSKEKGILTMLKAIKGLDMQLRIVGDGPFKKECEQYVLENNLENVHFKGYRSGKDLRRLYQNAAFLIVPSEWYETFGLIIVEAFANGKTVIGSDIGAIPETVIEGETGLLFEPGNHEELREKIIQLLSKPGCITDMGMRARRKVELDYAPGKHYKRLMEVYHRALL